MLRTLTLIFVSILIALPNYASGEPSRKDRGLRGCSGLAALAHVDKALVEQLGTAADGRRQLVEEGANLVASYRRRFKKLYPLFGFNNLSEVKAETLKHENGQDAMRALETGRLVVGINRTTRIRDLVTLGGIKNLNTIGENSLDHWAGARDFSESRMLEMDEIDYAKLPAEVRAHYGIIRPHPSTGELGFDDRVDRYGSDTYFLKSIVLKDRVTAYYRDSLDEVYPMLVDRNRPRNKKSAELLFVPMQSIALYAGMMRFDSENSKWEFQYPENNVRGLLGPRDYFEIQIFGPIGLEHVEAFQFNKEPPTGEFLRALLVSDIAIYDGRTGTAVPYKD